MQIKPFSMKDFVLGLVLEQRHKVIRKRRGIIQRKEITESVVKRGLETRQASFQNARRKIKNNLWGKNGQHFIK